MRESETIDDLAYIHLQAGLDPELRAGAADLRRDALEELSFEDP